MADCKVLGDFLHILKVEERIEASFILRREKKIWNNYVEGK